MSSIFMIKIGQTEIVVDAAVYVMTKRWDSVCNLKDADPGPKLVRFVDSEALSLLVKDAQDFKYNSKILPSVLTKTP
jgi:hypothetical protein